MSHTLIVNKNGLLSACPTDEQFHNAAFITDPQLVSIYSVKVHPSTFRHLYTNRDNVYVLHESLPAKDDQPERVHYVITDGWLKRAK